LFSIKKLNYLFKLKKITIILLLLVFTSCDNNQNSGKDNGKNVSLNLNLTLDWATNPHHAPLIIAFHKGFFEKQGLNIKLLPAVGSVEGCRQVAAGAAHFALTSEAQFLSQKIHGLKLSPVIIIISKPLEAIVSRVPIKNLKGKKIGHASSNGGVSHLCMVQILKANNINESDVEKVYTKNSLYSLILTKQADAIMNVYTTYVAVDLNNYKEKFYTHTYQEYGVPHYAPQVIVASEQLTKDVRERFIKALQEAYSYIKSNPSQAWMDVIAFAPELNNQRDEKVWALVVPLFEATTCDAESSPSFGDNNGPLKTFLEKLT